MIFIMLLMTTIIIGQIIKQNIPLTFLQLNFYLALYHYNIRITIHWNIYTKRHTLHNAHNPFVDLFIDIPPFHGITKVDESAESKLLHKQ